MTAAAPEVATPPGTTRPARIPDLQALSPDAGSHSTVCLPSPARRTGRRLIPVAGCGEPQAAARDRGSRPRRPAPPREPAQPAPGRAAARTRRPPIRSLPPPGSQKLGESGGAAAPACHRDLGAWPRRLARTARRDHPRTPEAPRTTLPPGPGRSSRPSTAPATTTPAALPSGNPPKALCQPHHRHRRNVLAARTATRQRAPSSPRSPRARPPWTRAISRSSAPPHTAALNLLPQTPTAQPARHLTEQPVTLRHRTSARLAPRTAITYACCCPVPAHGGTQITVILTAARVAVATDRIRICRK